MPVILRLSINLLYLLSSSNHSIHILTELIHCNSQHHSTNSTLYEGPSPVCFKPWIWNCSLQARSWVAPCLYLDCAVESWLGIPRYLVIYIVVMPAALEAKSNFLQDEEQDILTGIMIWYICIRTRLPNIGMIYDLSSPLQAVAQFSCNSACLAQCIFTVETNPR